jgi:hypothetical protein
VVDFDADLVMAAIQGNAVEPLTTIGWLMWHIGSMPGRLAQLDFLGGSKTTDTGWTSPYLTPTVCSRTRRMPWTQCGLGGGFSNVR